MTRCKLAVLVAALSTLSSTASARDWARFRGPNGTGQSQDAAPPVRWGDDQNLAWRVEMPGPGSSCPIVVGDKVLVTCWTGYGLSQEDPGDQADLRRSLVCFDRSNGKQLWRSQVDPELPEDEYRGMFAQHGYASHTPASDGERVYAYFGKSGAVAYDLEGNELWRADCGDGFGAKDWGSAASPIVAGDLVICSATAESNSLVALDKKTGEEVWRHTEEGWNGSWTTPVLATGGDRDELIYAAPFKVVALDPATGEQLWTCRGADNDTISSSPVLADGVVYVVQGRGGSLAVRTGGSGEVDDTHVLWRAELQGSIPTPVVYDGKIYGPGRGGVNCYDAATGERVYQARFEAPAGEVAEAEPPQREEREEREGGREGDNEGGRRGRRGRGGGRFGSMPYASPVAAGDRLYLLNRDGSAYVVRMADKFEQLARNTLADGGDFSGTPALSDGEMFVRSSKYLYCIRELGERVAFRR